MQQDEQDPASGRAAAVVNAQFVASTHSTCIACAPCAPEDYAVGAGSVTCVCCSGMIEAFSLAFAMLLHPRLGAKSNLGDMPGELVRQVLDKCTEVTSIPRGAHVVPTLFVPTTDAEYHAYIQNTRIKAPNGLWVSGAFRYYADPHPAYDTAKFSFRHCRMSFREHQRPTNREAQAVWHDTDTSCAPQGQESYFIVVKLYFSLQQLPTTEMNTVDVRALPHVQRAVANLTDHSVTRVEYDRLKPGKYSDDEDAQHSGLLEYKRIVQGRNDSADTPATTMGEVWEAIVYAEGWSQHELDRIVESHVEHFPPDGIRDRTVFDHMTMSKPESDPNMQEAQDEIDYADWSENGGGMVQISWPVVY